MAVYYEKIIEEITEGKYDGVFSKLYSGVEKLEYQKLRYISGINRFAELYGKRNIEIYSAPGRTEIGGNHTDHQNGTVLAAAVNTDTVGFASANSSNVINIKSEGYDAFKVALTDLCVKKEDEGTTKALVLGIAKEFMKRGYAIGGFDAYVISDVLCGSGLSSSAAFEVLICNIIKGLFGADISPEEIAFISMTAENEYFGKPCGLMDQMAVSVGGLVYMDFMDSDKPVIEKISTDFSEYNYSLCITDTKDSHAQLTEEYSSVLEEMRSVAACFGKKVLREVKEESFYEALSDIRKKVNDRALLRAIHFFAENKRPESEKKLLENNDFEGFLKKVKESGNSSYKLLQNAYAISNPNKQGIPLALALTEDYLKAQGACRVHGGGFAGTIQAFVPNDKVMGYKEMIEKVFGENSCHILCVREKGGIRLI